MAAALAVLAEEGGAAEAAEGEGAFTEDSEENASSQGVDVEGLIKAFGQVLGMAVNIYETVRLFKNSKNEDADMVRQRRGAGIVYPNENRLDLVKSGRIPAYYSGSNIRLLLRDNVLPFGWSELTAVNQGFGEEINTGRFRKRNKFDSNRLKNKLERERGVAKNISTLELFNKKLKNHRDIELLKSNIM